MKGKNKFKNKVWNPKALALIFRETRKKNNLRKIKWYLHELDGCCCDSISNPFGSFRCVVVGICSPPSPAAVHMSNAVVNAVGHGFTFDIDKITKNYSADCISWNPTKHKEVGGWWIMDCTKGDVARDKPYWNNSWAAWQRNGHVSVQNRKKMMDSFHIASQVMATWAEQWHLLFGPWWNSDLSQDSECIADLHRYPPHLSKMAPALAQQSSQRARSGCAQLHYRLNRWRHHVGNGRSIYLSGSPGDMVHGWCFTS